MNKLISSAALLLLSYFQVIAQSPSLSWVNGIGSSSFEEGKSTVVDASGNVIVTGYFLGTPDFDPGIGTTTLASNGGQDIFVAKYDNSGALVWAKSFGSASPDQGLAIQVDASGNIYTTGNFQGSVDFDPGPSSSILTSGGMTDIFVSKLDASGNFMWAKKNWWRG